MGLPTSSGCWQAEMSRCLWCVQVPHRAQVRAPSVSPVPLIHAGPKCPYVCKYCLCSQHACMGGSVSPFYGEGNSPRKVVTFQRPRISQMLRPPEVPSPSSRPPRSAPVPGVPCRGQTDRSPSTETVTKQWVPGTVTSRGISPAWGLGRGTKVQGTRLPASRCFPWWGWGVDNQPRAPSRPWL